MENHGKSLQNHGEIIAKSWRNHGEIMAKSLQNPGEIMADTLSILDLYRLVGSIFSNDQHSMNEI